MKRIFYAILAGVILAGCGVILPAKRSEAKLSRLSLGQTREEVIASVGYPSVVRGARKFANGDTLEVAEYRLFSKNAWWFNMFFGIPTFTLAWWIPSPAFTPVRFYWVQYVNGKVDRWGVAGDWEPNLTADITVRNGHANQDR